MKQFKEGKYTLDQAQKILGQVSLTETEEYVEAHSDYINMNGVCAYSPHTYKKCIGEKYVWATPSGLYVDAEM